MAGTKQERKKGRRVDLRWLQPLAVLLEATGGGAGGSRWPTVLFFFSLSSVFRSLLRFFSSSFGLPLLFSLLSLLFSALSFLFPPHFSRALPCIYRKNRGDRGKGWPLCNRPKNCPRNTPPSSPTRGKLRASGVGQRLFERELAVENRGRKNLLLPLLRASRGRKKVTVPFKTTPFWSPFFSFF